MFHLLKLFLISAILCFVLSGCAASNAEMHAGFDPWVGQSVDALIMKWGTPNNIYKTPSGEYTIYTWIYDGGTQVTAAYYQSINMVYASAQRAYCRIDWTADQQAKLLNFRWEGRCRVIHQ